MDSELLLTDDSRVADDDALLSEVPFGRSRFLKVLGSGLAGFAVQMAYRAEPAQAAHVGPPPPCYGYRKCHACHNGNCTRDCTYVGYMGCPSGRACWTGCYGGRRYKCCDYKERFPGGSTHNCLCRGDIGAC